MPTPIRLPAAALIALAASAFAGCSSYYQVADPASGRVYYTKDVDDEGKAGAVRFRDERTHSTVTLPSSQVREVSRERYEEGLMEGR